MSTYKQVSAREIIRRVVDSFNIKTSDFEVRAIEWIGEALREMNIYNALCLKHKNLTISEYKAELPCDIYSLRAILVNGVKATLPIIGSINAHDPDVLIANIDGNTYELNHNGFIICSSRTGIVRISYLTIPSVFDNETKMEIPLVPDNEKVINACVYFVMFKYLGRGNKHPVYSLKAQQSHLNPYSMWVIYKAKARNTRMQLNKDERDRHRQIWNNFTYAQNAADEVDVISGDDRSAQDIARTNIDSLYGTP